MEWGFWALLVMNMVQLFFWGIMVQRLVDKLMSRNYHEYQVASGVKTQEERPKMDFGIPEDMRSLNEIIPY
jgi:hypothetical protein